MKKSILISLVLFIFVILVGGIYLMPQHNEFNDNMLTVSLANNSKPIILLVIDSLMSKPLKEAIKKGKAPAFNFLINKGIYNSKVVSSFPTMSVTIDTSLITGTYPDKHKIPGLVWYNENHRRIINYGNGKREVIKLGLKQVMQDNILNLNNEHLNKDVITIFEELNRKQKLSASINMISHRGTLSHELNIPKSASFFRLLPKESITYGPDILSFGMLAKIKDNNRYYHFWQNFGFNNNFAVSEIKYLIDNRMLPDLTIAYFPDLDKTVHKNGPNDIKGIEQLDLQLQEILNSFDTWDKAIAEAIWVVTGDSGQTEIGKDRKKNLINLKHLLNEYLIPKLSKKIANYHQIVLAVNERMAYVYVIDLLLNPSDIAVKLKNDARIDIIAWKEEDIIKVISGEKNGEFKFKPGENFIDQYKQNWNIEGNQRILDITLRKNYEITYNDYPDVLARLYGALNSHDGRYIVITAKPGYEFIAESSPTHLGGAGHGSLHKTDSLVPMIIVGTDSYPENLRLVDVKDWLLQILQ